METSWMPQCHPSSILSCCSDPYHRGLCRSAFALWPGNPCWFALDKGLSMVVLQVLPDLIANMKFSNKYEAGYLGPEGNVTLRNAGS